MRPSRHFRPWLVGLGLAFVAVYSSREALAQQAPDPSIALAESLFQQARGLLKQERYSEACPMLAESQRLDPKLGTLMNLAHCHENEGKTATAFAEYRSALALAEKSGKKDREDYARERIDVLQTRLAHAVLHVDGQPPEGLALFIDDKPFPLSALYEKTPLDPGKHTISATAPGKRSFVAEIDVPPWPGDVPLTIPPLEALPPPPENAAPPPPAPAPKPAAPKVPAPATDEPGRHAMILMTMGFGGAAAGFIVGAVAGIATLAKAGELVPTCDGSSCPASAKDDIETANDLATASNVGFGVALLGLGVGIVGVALLPSRAAAPKSAAGITPFVGPGTIGLRGAF